MTLVTTYLADSPTRPYRHQINKWSTNHLDGLTNSLWFWKCQDYELVVQSQNLRITSFYIELHLLIKWRAPLRLGSS